MPKNGTNDVSKKTPKTVRTDFSLENVKTGKLILVRNAKNGTNDFSKKMTKRYEQFQLENVLTKK